MDERIVFTKGRKQGRTYELCMAELYKRKKLESDLCKLVEDLYSESTAPTRNIVVKGMQEQMRKDAEAIEAVLNKKGGD